MKFILIGGNGALGRDIKSVFEKYAHEVISYDLPRLDITKHLQIKKIILDDHPDATAVINCAAFHHTGRCEEDKETAFKVNAIGQCHVAELSKRAGMECVYISTDYVFGTFGRWDYYSEDDKPNPISSYGITKLAGELYTRAYNPKHYIVRTCGLYGINPCVDKGGHNFVTTILRKGKENGEVKVVSDEVVSPTYTVDLSMQILRLLLEGERDRGDFSKYGVYHAVNRGQCSWYDFARRIESLSPYRFKVTATKVEDNKVELARPQFSALNNKRLRDRNIDIMPKWEDAVERFISELKESGRL